MKGNTFYVIDTSSLIDMNMYYPMSVFKSVWQQCEGLIHEGRLASPIVVFDEIERKDDELKAWAQEHNGSLFHEYTPYLLEQVGVILKEFPKLINSAHEHEQADPFVIAMALDRRDGPQQTLDNYHVYVVAEEKMPPAQGKRPKKTKIPEVCQYFGLPYISMVEMIVNEGWKF